MCSTTRPLRPGASHERGHERRRERKRAARDPPLARVGGGTARRSGTRERPRIASADAAVTAWVRALMRDLQYRLSRAALRTDRATERWDRCRSRPARRRSAAAPRPRSSALVMSAGGSCVRTPATPAIAIGRRRSTTVRPSASVPLPLRDAISPQSPPRSPVAGTKAPGCGVEPDRWLSLEDRREEGAGGGRSPFVQSVRLGLGYGDPRYGNAAWVCMLNDGAAWLWSQLVTDPNSRASVGRDDRRHDGARCRLKRIVGG